MNEWISVDSMLPAGSSGSVRSKSVLVYFPSNKCTFTMMFNFKSGLWEHFAAGSLPCYDQPSHWMPLPEPPK